MFSVKNKLGIILRLNQSAFNVFVTIHSTTHIDSKITEIVD